MLERVGGSDLSETFRRPIAKRATACCQNYASQTRVGMSLKTLENGVMLAVDRQQFHVMAAGGGHHEFTGENEHFFGSQRDVLASGDRVECRLKANGSDDCDQHEIGFGERREVLQSGESAMQLRTDGESARSFRVEIGLVIKDSDVGNIEIAGDFREACVVLSRCDSDEFKFVPVSGDDTKGVLADGAGRAEKDDALGGSWRR